MDIDKFINKYKIQQELQEEKDMDRFLDTLNFQNNYTYYEKELNKNKEICRLLQEIKKHRYLNKVLQNENNYYTNKLRSLESKCKKLRTEIYTQNSKIFSLQTENEMMQKLIIGSVCKKCQKKIKKNKCC